MLAREFAHVEVERWDLPLVRLPDAAAVRDYLVGKGVAHDAAEARARTVTTPLTVTKRGALLYGRRP